MKNIRSILSILLANVICIQAEPPGVATLKEAYRDAFLIGCAVNTAITSGKDRFSRDIVLEQFNSVTPENILKAESVNPRPGIFNFVPADEYVEFAEKNNMFIVGHTLIWHNQTPQWFFIDEDGNPKSRNAIIERMRDHIKTVAGRYAGRINAWGTGFSQQGIIAAGAD